MLILNRTDVCNMDIGWTGRLIAMPKVEDSEGHQEIVI